MEDNTNTKENGGTIGDELAKSLQALENVTQIFACVKCGTVPSAKDKLYTLGNCSHKYCAPCVDGFSGEPQPCVASACLMSNIMPGKAVEDSFSSSVLIGLAKLKGELHKIPRISAPSAVYDSDLVSAPTPRSATKIKNSPRKKLTKTKTCITETEKSPVPAKRTRNSSPDMGDLEPKATKRQSGRNTTTSEEPTKMTALELIPVKQGYSNDSPDISDLPAIKRKRGLVSTKKRSKATKTTSELQLQKPESVTPGRVSPDIMVEMDTSTPKKPAKAKKKKGRSKSTNSGIKSAESTPSSSNENEASTSGKRNASFTSPSVKMEKKNAKGETQLHIACRKGELEKVQQLIMDGADPNLQDFAGWTPLHEAINGKASPSSKLDLVKVLFEHRACNPNIPGMDKETVLHDAVRRELPEIISYLLEHGGASPNIRNQACKLPRDIATEEIAKILEDASKFSNESLVDDPAVLAVQLATALVHFQNASSDLYSKTEQILKLNVSKELRTGVTHLVFPSEGSGSGEVEKVTLSLEYLFGMATGAWMLNARWITKSLAAKKVLSPSAFEIFGCVLDPERINSPVRLARLNKEIGNPGLLHGFCFYFYKNTAFRNLERRDLISVVNLAGGLVITLPPNPNDVDPLEYPVRFHASQDNQKFVLTSHIILYDGENKPPANKMYNMEHIKTLKIQWLIDSMIHFELLDPDNYL